MPMENVFVRKLSQAVHVESQQIVAEGVASCAGPFPPSIPRGEVQAG